MSGDIFKKAFSKSVEEVQPQKSNTKSETKIIRDHIEDIRKDIEGIIWQIPSVFEVLNVRFDVKVYFEVSIPRNKSYLIAEIGFHPQKGDAEWVEKMGVEELPRYSGNIDHADVNGNSLKHPGWYSGWVYRDAAIEWLASELGRILGEEYERHRDFYEKMEEGL